MSSTYHPQSDVQSEVVIKVIVMYLRCLSGDKAKDWVRWLPWAKYYYNTSHHTSLRTTTFNLEYGRDPPALRSFDTRTTKVPTIDDLLTQRDYFLLTTRERLRWS
jgi:hypothetical protein